MVTAPSNHVSGGSYSWKAPPEAYPAAKILTGCWAYYSPIPRADKRYQGPQAPASTVPKGQRNATLTSLAGAMRRPGMSQEAIEAALLVENKKCSPKLPDAEVLAIARSISRYAPGSQGPATGGAWPKPEPLRRLPEPGEPFPVEALGPIMGDAAKAMHGIIKAPLAVCGQSVLATGNLAVQGHADVVIDGRCFPVSENLLSIAETGERKTVLPTKRHWVRSMLTNVNA